MICLEMPAHSRHLQVAASFIKAISTVAGFDEDASEAIEISVMEAVENVIDHSGVAVDGTVCLRVWEDQGDFIVEIADHGVPWPDAILTGKIGREMPPPDASRGRGLAMMRELMDDVIPENCVNGGKTLRLVKHRTRIEAG
jgi:anti-sigma regulatory factor (Ser/Thr protein kinase)